MTGGNKKLRCAVYTRKSSEEGLDQEFNSLDAQRIAGEAYIQSQQHEGWTLVKTGYNDGGYSGGNIERPGLKKLISDIKQRKVDVVVVYKIDRLTRSLMDFSKLVEIFDAHNVSFVSVTQSFNTTTSMGRLTLNVLLSFAQFEREVTGERIRDKIKASKQKGIWMGGRPPLGYDVVNRKLIINEEEAEQIHYIYEQYLKKNSCHKILVDLNTKGITQKSWVTQKGKAVTGKAFTTTTIYNLLKNPIYLGKLKYKDSIYDGEHNPIIDQDIWDKVQNKLKSRTVNKNGRKNKVAPFLLKGKIFDDAGRKYSTTYTSKTRSGIRKFTRYYVMLKEAKKGYVITTPRYINADEIKEIAHSLLTACLKGEPRLQKQWHGVNPKQRDLLLKKAIVRVIINKDKIRAEFDKEQIKNIIDKYKKQDIAFIENVRGRKRTTSNIDVIDADTSMACVLNYAYKSYKGKKIITDGSGRDITAHKTNKNPDLISALVTAHQCHEHLKKAVITSIKKLSKKMKRDPSYISKIIKLYSLSPKIKATILDGNQPRTTTVQLLIKISQHIDWKKQESMFGI